jgi:hypothetical protein
MLRSASVLFVIGALAAAAPAAAQDDGGRFYLGAGFGVAEFTGIEDGIAYEDSPAGPHLFGGFELRDRVAIELALARLNGIEALDIAGSGVERLSISADYTAVAVRGTFSIALADVIPRWSKWSVFATAGVYSSEEDRRVIRTVSSRTSLSTVDDDGLALGAGAIYALPLVSLRAHLEWYDSRYSDRWGLAVAAQFRF